jgi:hypothetical protein
MFLDESGNHDLNPRRINPIYPVFVLGGAIVDRAYLRNTIAPEMRQFKLRHFGREEVVLHTVEMGKGRRDFGFLADPGKRAAFYTELNTMLERWEYTVVACVFELERYIAQSTPPVDPYHLGLEILVEQFCEVLGEEEDAGFICAEMRNPGLDRALLNAWERLRSSHGVGGIGADAIDAKIVDLSLKEKQPALAGLQLADLVVTPPGRHIAGRPEHPNQVQWAVIRKKLRKTQTGDADSDFIILP